MLFIRSNFLVASVTGSSPTNYSSYHSIKYYTTGILYLYQLMESPQQQTRVRRLTDLLASLDSPTTQSSALIYPPSTHRPLRGLSSNQHAACSGGVLEAPPTSGRRATFLLRAGGEIPADPQRVSRPPLVRFLSSQRQPDQPVAPVCHTYMTVIV